MKRKLIYLILVTFLAGVAMAQQDVSIRADHPDEYTVVEGDTLWDISARFLDHPWQWPAIWHANQQIENPHLIYPGDVLSLVFIDGEPRLVVDRGKPTVRVSPEVRQTKKQAVMPIPFDDLDGFITNVRVVSEEEYQALPYVVANNEQRFYAAETDLTYARNVRGEVGDRFAIVRLGHIYYQKKGEVRAAIEPGYGLHAPPSVEWHPGFWERAAYFDEANHGEVIGYELYEVAEATLSKQGDPAILTVMSGEVPVKVGDLVVPLDSIGYPKEFMPHAMDRVPEDMRVLAVQGDNHIAGHYKIVSIAGGSRQGVELGHVFSAFEPGDRIRDKVKYPAGSLADARTWNGDKVTLPDEFDAHIMVFRVFDEVSYALVMQGPRAVKVNDVLKHPDETL